MSEQVARILDGYQTRVASLNAEVEILRERLDALIYQVVERFDFIEFEVPDRPEADEPDVDRDGFLYDSGRHWLTQLGYWQRYRDGDAL